MCFHTTVQPKKALLKKDLCFLCYIYTYNMFAHYYSTEKGAVQGRSTEIYLEKSHIINVLYLVKIHIFVQRAQLSATGTYKSTCITLLLSIKYEGKKLVILNELHLLMTLSIKVCTLSIKVESRDLNT